MKITSEDSHLRMLSLYITFLRVNHNNENNENNNDKLNRPNVEKAVFLCDSHTSLFNTH
jgi:hypothetical protein